MKLSKLILILTITSTFSSLAQCQFYKKIRVEMGVNRSATLNTKDIVPDQTLHPEVYRNSNIRTSPAYSYNYSMSIGVQLFKNHNFSIRQSSNSLATNISGNFIYQHHVFCSVGDSPPIYENAINLFKNTTLGGKYEFHLPIDEDAIVFGLGFEKQWNNYDDTFVIFPGVLYDNYAAHASIGYITSLFSFFELHSKLFVTRSFENTHEVNNSYYDTKFVPMQVGFELGVRMNFEKF